MISCTWRRTSPRVISTWDTAWREPWSEDARRPTHSRWHISPLYADAITRRPTKTRRTPPSVQEHPHRRSVGITKVIRKGVLMTCYRHFTSLRFTSRPYRPVYTYGIWVFEYVATRATIWTCELNHASISYRNSSIPILQAIATRCHRCVGGENFVEAGVESNAQTWLINQFSYTVWRRRIDQDLSSSYVQKIKSKGVGDDKLFCLRSCQTINPHRGAPRRNSKRPDILIL